LQQLGYGKPSLFTNFDPLYMEAQQVLDRLKQIVAPKQLSFIEETVFLQAWGGKRYRDMALETGYEEGYLKDIGSQLWLCLSRELGCQITKKNLRFQLGECLGLKGSYLLASSTSSSAFKQLEFPGAPLPFGSPLYVERPPVEDLAIASIHQPGSLIRLQAPHYMGKTSLINQVFGVAQQSGMHTIMIDMQQADTEAFDDLDQLLRWFYWAIAQQLNLEPQLGEDWPHNAGSKLSCTTYMQEYLLKQVKQPIVLAIDKVHYLIEYPKLARQFFPLLRAWYEQARVQADWQKLRFIIAHSTKLDIPLQSHQSPFNVGLPLKLPELTTTQVKDLFTRYELNTVGIHDFSLLEPLLHLLGGHPYLLQLAFYWLRSQYFSLSQLIKEATCPDGIYGDLLNGYWLTLQRDEHLMQAFCKLLTATTPIHLDTSIAYRLEGMGLVKLNGIKASIQCELYRRYFCAQIDDLTKQLSDPPI